MIYGQGRQRLLAAAEAAIAERGIDAVTTRDLCARAGVQAPALYHHFGTKDALLEQLLEEVYGRYRATKQEVPLSGDPVIDTRRGWDAHVAFARSHAALYLLMLRSGSAASAAGLASLRAGFDRLDETGALRPGVTPQLATIVLSSALRGMAARICRTPEDPETTRASEVLRDAVIGALVIAPEGDGSTRDDEKSGR